MDTDLADELWAWDELSDDAMADWDNAFEPMSKGVGNPCLLCRDCRQPARWNVWYVGCGNVYASLCDDCLAKQVADGNAWPVAATKLVPARFLPENDRSKLPWHEGEEAARNANSQS